MPRASLEGLTPEQIEEAADMYRSIVTNPKTREAALRASRVVNPSLTIPDLDLKDAAMHEFKTRDEKIAAQDMKILAMESERRIERQRLALKEKGFEQTDVDAIEKLMVDRQIPNYDTAAEFYANSKKLAEPTPDPHRDPAPRQFQMPDMLGAAKGGRQSLNRTARDTAATALDEIRSGRVKLTH